MELAIDTSTDIASLALSSEGQVVVETTWRAGQNHTSQLMPNLVELLRLARVDLDNISGLVIAKGPGSFNGLRVGMSVAKGLAFALKIPLVGVSTLEATAYPYAATGLPVCPVQDAGRGEIAAAVFQIKRGKWRRLIEEHIAAVYELLQMVAGRTIFCGELPDDVVLQIREGLGGKALILGGGGTIRRAGYLAELGWMRLKDGDFDHSPTLQPLYLRRPSITVSPKGR
jgi:tRNA threonylcarbamoyl adenosine modification protein YeaZ